MRSQSYARLGLWLTVAVAIAFVAMAMALLPGSADAQTATPTATGTSTPTATPTSTATTTPTATPTATADPDEPVVEGEVPTSGVALLTLNSAATPDEIVDELDGMGCEVETIAITVGGGWSVYVPGAPDFVNEDFPEELSAGAPFAVRCN